MGGRATFITIKPLDAMLPGDRPCFNHIEFVEAGIIFQVTTLILF